MSRVARGSVTALLATVVGCGSSTGGSPVPGDPRHNDPPETSAPTRPREVRLDGVDPCTLVSRSDWPTFYIEKPGKPRHDEVFNSPGCFYVNDIGSVDVTLVQTEGIEAWDEGKRRVKRAEVVPVLGFPSLSIALPNDKNACAVVVDVADGQYLMAEVDILNGKLSALPEKCEYARQLADSAMRTLVG